VQVSLIFFFIGSYHIAEAEMSEDDMYPIIISTHADTALLILPDKGCHVIVDTR